MNISIAQTNIQWADPTANQLSAERLIQELAKTDLLVLPEMWNTGFMTDGNTPRHEESLQWMTETARSKNIAVCGSLAVDEGKDRLYNRLYFVYPDGTTMHYDKRHLFGYGGEDKHYAGGSERTIVEYGEMRFLLAVCYDLRFPVWLRNNGDYDAIIIVANWPESRKRVWTTLLQARAIENQCFVIACNRVGDDPVCHYSGGSAIIDAKGKFLAQDHEREEVLTTDISREELMQFRRKFPVLDDRDSFSLT